MSGYILIAVLYITGESTTAIAPRFNSFDACDAARLEMQLAMPIAGGPSGTTWQPKVKFAKCFGEGEIK